MECIGRCDGAPAMLVDDDYHGDLTPEKIDDNQALVELASAFHVPVIATNGVRFASPDARPLYDVLTCLRHKTTIARAGRRLLPHTSPGWPAPGDPTASTASKTTPVPSLRQIP